MHLKRQKVPKTWPIERKGTTYVVRPNFNLESGIPILIVMRNMLKKAQHKREVKRAIYLKQILVNGKPVKDEKNAVLLFDVVSIVPSKEHYRVELSTAKKFEMKEIKEAEAHEKIAKIILVLSCLISFLQRFINNLLLQSDMVYQGKFDLSLEGGATRVS